MALIPDVKCSRCDRRYSGLHSKCPYCGARRLKKGKRVADGDNATLKLIITILLFVLLITAIIVLIVGSKKDNNDTPDNPSSSISDSSSSDSSSDSSDSSGSSDSSDSSDSSSSDSSSDSSSSSSSTEQEITSVIITYLGDKREDITMEKGEVVPLGYKTSPIETTETAIWKSSNEDVFIVLQTGKVTAIGAGEAELTVTIGDVTAKCLIRVNN